MRREAVWRVAVWSMLLASCLVFWLCAIYGMAHLARAVGW